MPTAELAGPKLDIGLLIDDRERLVGVRVALNNTLQWHLHDLWPELELPGSRLFYGKCSARVARRLARAEQTMRVRIARDELRRLRELTQAINALEAEIAELVAAQLLDEPGFGPLTAAKLVGEIAGAARFATDAKLARAAGLAPIPVSSGRTDRHRLDRGGNRQINAAIDLVAVTRARCHPETIDFVARKKTEGKTTAKRSGRSRATSHGASARCCVRPTRCQKPLPTHQSLDKGAAESSSDHRVTWSAAKEE